MASFVVGNVSFSSIDNAQSSGSEPVPVDGKYWVEQVYVGPPQYDRRKIWYPGVDQAVVKMFGYRGQIVVGKVMYMYGSVSTVYSTMNADRAALSNTLFNVTPPHRSQIENCELADFTEGFIYKSKGDGKYAMICQIRLFHIGNT